MMAPCGPEEMPKYFHPGDRAHFIPCLYHLPPTHSAPPMLVSHHGNTRCPLSQGLCTAHSCSPECSTVCPDQSYVLHTLAKMTPSPQKQPYRPLFKISTTLSHSGLDLPNSPFPALLLKFARAPLTFWHSLGFLYYAFYLFCHGNLKIMQGLFVPQ